MPKTMKRVPPTVSARAARLRRRANPGDFVMKTVKANSEAIDGVRSTKKEFLRSLDQLSAILPILETSPMTIEAPVVLDLMKWCKDMTFGLNLEDDHRKLLCPMAFEKHHAVHKARAFAHTMYQLSLLRIGNDVRKGSSSRPTPLAVALKLTTATDDLLPFYRYAIRCAMDNHAYDSSVLMEYEPEFVTSVETDTSQYHTLKVHDKKHFALQVLLSMLDDLDRPVPDGHMYRDIGACLKEFGELDETTAKAMERTFTTECVETEHREGHRMPFDKEEAEDLYNALRLAVEESQKPIKIHLPLDTPTLRMGVGSTSPNEEQGNLWPVLKEWGVKASELAAKHLIVYNKASMEGFLKPLSKQ